MSRKTVILRDLEPAQAYALQLRSRDWKGHGPWSPKFSFETIEDTVAPNAPSNVTVVVDSADFVITYNPPSLNEDGSITEDLKDFVIDIWPDGSPEQTRRFFTSAHRLRFTFQDGREVFGTPQKHLRFDVMSRDLAGNISENPEHRDAINLEPAGFNSLEASPERQAIKIQWNRPAGTNPGSNNAFDLDYYEIFRNGQALAEVGNGSYTFLDADPGRGSHDYFIRVHDVYGNTLDSNQVTESAQGYWEDDTSVPKPPTITSVSTNIDDADAFIELTFDAPVQNEDNSDYTDHLGFEVRWALEDSGNPGSPAEPYNTNRIADERAQGTDLLSVTYKIENIDSGVNYLLGVRAYDRYNNYSAWAEDSIVTAVDDTVPNKPSQPIVAGNLQSIQVRHDLKDFNGDPLPKNVESLDIHVSSNSGFSPDYPADGSTTLESRVSVNELIRMGQSLVWSFPYEVSDANQDRYVRVVAVTGYPKFSDASDTVGPELVELIQDIHIEDATITSAKIFDLEANKLTAGTGIINDLLIKSQLTIDQLGNIQSTNYSPGTSGFYFDDQTLEINEGSIAAAALEVTLGANLVPAPYSVFTLAEEWYATKINEQDHTYEITAVDAWFGETSLLVEKPTTNDGSLIVGTGYPIRLSESGDYTLSLYTKGTSATSVTVYLFEETAGNIGNTGSPQVSTNWERIEHTFTGLSPGKYQFRIVVNGQSIPVYFDALQLEKSSVASEFKVSGLTNIDGGMLTTGQIRSTDWVSSGGTLGWRIDLDGNIEANDGRFRGTIEAMSGWIRNTMEVGTSQGTGEIRSKDFDGDLGNELAGTTGWGVHSNGYVVFNKGRFRGNVRDGGGNNMWPDPTFSDSVIGDFVATGDTGTWSIDQRGVGDSWIHSGDSAVRIDFNGTSGQGWFRGPGDDVNDPIKNIPISSGDKFYISFYHGANSSASNADITSYIVFRDSDGNVVGSGAYTGGTTSMRAASGNYAFYESTFTAPAGAAYVEGGVKVFDRGDTGIGFIDSMTMRRALPATLIVDGIIQASVRIELGANLETQLGDGVAGSSNHQGLSLSGDTTDDILIRRTSDDNRFFRLSNSSGTRVIDFEANRTSEPSFIVNGDARFNDVTVSGLFDGRDGSGTGITVEENEIGFYDSGTLTGRINTDSTWAIVMGSTVSLSPTLTMGSGSIKLDGAGGHVELDGGQNGVVINEGNHLRLQNGRHLRLDDGEFTSNYTDFYQNNPDTSIIRHYWKTDEYNRIYFRGFTSGGRVEISSYDGATLTAEMRVEGHNSRARFITGNVLVDNDFTVLGSKNALIVDPVEPTVAFQFAATESDRPGILEHETEVQQGNTYHMPEHWQRITKNLRVVSLQPLDAQAGNAWPEINGWGITVQGQPGRYWMLVRADRADEKVKSWQHVVDVTPDDDIEEETV